MAIRELDQNLGSLLKVAIAIAKSPHDRDAASIGVKIQLTGQGSVLAHAQSFTEQAAVHWNCQKCENADGQDNAECHPAQQFSRIEPASDIAPKDVLADHVVLADQRPH
jgi:hypothetical protein